MRRSGKLVLVLIVALAAAPLVQADWNKGVELFKKGKWAEAEEEFLPLVRNNPEGKSYAGVYFMLGYCQLQQGKLSAAIENLSKAATYDPSRADYKLLLGTAQLKAGKASEAAKTLKGIDPSKLSSKNQIKYALTYAKVQMKLGRYESAERIVSQQLKRTPKNVNLWLALASARRELGKDMGVYEAYKKAYEISKKVDYGRNAVKAAILAARRAAGATKKQRYQQAYALAEKIALTSPSYESYLTAGEAAMGAKMYNKALKWFSKAEAKRKNALVAFYIGQCYSSLGKYKKAEAKLREALSFSPQGKLRKQIHNQMGYIYAKQKKYLEAEKEYRAAGNTKRANEMRQNYERHKKNIEFDNWVKEQKQKIAQLKQKKAQLEQAGLTEEAAVVEEQIKLLENNLQQVLKTQGGGK